METLYQEAVTLSDKAREWFDGAGLEWRRQLPADAEALVATEGLAVIARLMAVMSWLLDPAHGRPDAPAPVFDDRSVDERPVPPVLAGTPGGDIALASRQLAMRVATLAAGDHSGEDSR